MLTENGVVSNVSSSSGVLGYAVTGRGVLCMLVERAWVGVVRGGLLRDRMENRRGQGLRALARENVGIAV